MAKKATPEPRKNLTLEDLMAVDTRGMLKRETIDIPELPGVFFVQELTGGQLQDLWKQNKELEKAGGGENNFADSIRILQSAIVDGEGNQMFPDFETCEKFILSLPGNWITDLTNKAGELNQAPKDTEKN